MQLALQEVESTVVAMVVVVMVVVVLRAGRGRKCQRVHRRSL